MKRNYNFLLKNLNFFVHIIIKNKVLFIGNYQQYVDKETCEKVKEAAEAITQGIKETRETGQFVKDTITTNAGKVNSLAIFFCFSFNFKGN